MTAENEGVAGPSLWQRLELRARPATEASAGDGSLAETGGRLWPALGERLAAARPSPRLRPGLALKSLPPGAGPGALLADPAGRQIFRLGEREAAIVALFDGQRDLAAIVRDAPGAPSAAAVDRFVQDLRLAGLLDEGAGVWQRLAAPRRNGPLILWAPAGAERALAALRDGGLLRVLFHPLAWAVLSLLILAAVVLVAIRWPLPGEGLRELTAGPWPGLPLLLAAAYGLMLPIVLVHELAHALACTHHGGRVARLGLMIRHGLPAAFADVSDVHFLPRRARVAVYLAGPASTLATAALAALVAAGLPPGSFGQALAGAVTLLAALTGVAAIIPVTGYDGSEALAEWLQVPDLHRRVLGYWRGRLRGRRPGEYPLPTVAPPCRLYILRAYGLAFVAYNVAALALVIVVLVTLLY